MRRNLIAFFLPAFLSGCTGLSFGEKTPGSDVYLEAGDIAVDDRTETSFVLQTATPEASSDPKAQPPTPASALFAISPVTGSVSKLATMTDRSDARMLFPDNGVLLMSEINGKDRLELFDKDTLAPLDSASMSVRYHGTRMSPSRKYIAVADNTSEKAPIHIIDTASLEPRIIPHNGDWLEAMWMNNSDKLVTIVFYDWDLPTAHARVLSWSIQSVIDAQFQVDELSGLWPKPDMDIDLPGVTGDLFFSFTWVGISPDDHYGVFPVRKVEGKDTYSYELVVVDMTTSEVRTVPNAKGPVGFTPDGSTIVSYKDIPTGENINQSLLLINTQSLAIDQEDVPIDGGITYFISHDGAYVVVGSNNGDQRLVLYDVEQDKQTQMAGPGIGLNQFVSRGGHGELWLVDQEALFKLDLFKGELETVKTDFAPLHINILPKRDQLILDAKGSHTIRFWSPDARSTELSATLPLP